MRRTNEETLTHLEYFINSNYIRLFFNRKNREGWNPINMFRRNKDTRELFGTSITNVPCIELIGSIDASPEVVVLSIRKRS